MANSPATFADRARLRFVSSVFVLVLMGGVTLAPAQSVAKDDWAKNSKRCMDSFKKFDAVGLRELYECVALWEAYRTPASIKLAERITALQAFNFLCAHGEDEAAFVAEQAIYRLKDTPGPECLQRSKGGGPGGVAAPTVAPQDVPLTGDTRPEREVVRQRYDPSPVSAADTKKARDINAQGLQADKKGRTTQALELYERSIKTDPRYEQGIYNAACLHARTGASATAIEYLRRLRDMGSEEGVDRLRAARMDKDFASLRDQDEFKELTGFARIKLCNSKGEYGEDAVDDIALLLKKARYPVSEQCNYGQDLPFPVIFFRMGPARNTAVILSHLINHENVQLQEVEDDRDWDVAIVWGDTYTVNQRTGEPRPKDRSFKDPEKELDTVRQQEDRALREPERYARETEHRARTPERVQNRMEGNVRRVEQTKDTFDRAGRATNRALNLGK